jgi:hypothetical protein
MLVAERVLEVLVGLVTCWEDWAFPFFFFLFWLAGLGISASLFSRALLSLLSS